MASEGRRYSEDEFALILRKALELQDRPRAARGADPAEGLTIAEIQTIAREIGLDPALIEQAIASVPATRESAAARLLGGRLKYQLEYRAGAELSKAGLARVVDAIREATGHHGKVKEALGSTEWETVGQMSQIYVTVSPREGETFVRILADRGAAGVVSFVIPLVIGAIGIGGLGAIFEPTSVGGVLAVVAAPLATAFVTARTIWAATTRSFKRKVHDLMGATSRAVNENLQPPASEEPKLGVPGG